MKKHNNEKKLYYGYIVAIGCFFISVYSMGLTINIFSTFLPFIISEDHLSKTQGSSIISFQNLVSVITMLLSNRIYRKYPVRNVTYVCGIAMAIAYVIYANADTYLVYMAGATLMGLGYGCGGIVAISVLITNWFVTQRGRMLALGIMGTSVASMIFPPIISSSIINRGLDTSFFILSGLVFIFSTITFVLIRTTPEEMGLTPYGAIKTEDIVSPGMRGGPVPRKYREIIKKKEFIIIFYCAVFAGSTTLSVVPHFVSILVESGYDPVFSAAMFSLYGLFGLVGKWIYGIVVDYIGVKGSSLYIFLAWSGALLFVSLFTPFFVAPYMYAILIGIAIPVGTMPLPILAGHFFRKEEYIFVITIVNASVHILGAILSALPGAIADITGSYKTAYIFYFIAVIIAVVLIIVLFAEKKSHGDKVK